MTKDEKTAVGIGMLAAAALLLMGRKAKAKAPEAAEPHELVLAAQWVPVTEWVGPELAAADEHLALMKLRQGALIGWGSDVSEKRSPFSQDWTPGNLWFLADRIGGALDVAPEILWGVMWRESQERPVGVFGHDPSTQATEYGMSQIVRSRWLAELAQEATPSGTSHVDIIHPELAMVATALSYLRGQRKHGGDISFDSMGYRRGLEKFKETGEASWLDTVMGAPPEWLGAWWAKPSDIPKAWDDKSDASRRKYNDIIGHGVGVRAMRGAFEAGTIPAEFKDGPDRWAPDPEVIALAAMLEAGPGFVENLLGLAMENAPDPDSYGASPSEWGGSYASNPGAYAVEPWAADYFLMGSAFFPEHEWRDEE